MSTYVRRNSPTITAFVISDVSPEFHGHTFLFLDNDTVIEGTGNIGDYSTVAGEGLPMVTVAKDAFEAEWMPA